MELDELKELTKSGEKQLETGLHSELPAFVWIESFINLAGSTLYERENNREANDLDVVVRAEDDGEEFSVTLGSDLRLKIDRVLEDRYGAPSIEWIGEEHGPNWRYRPLWDLALVPHKPDETREINEPGFAGKFYKTKPPDVCMRCGSKPEYEILWAEGRGHAWFCRKHTLEFLHEKIKEKFSAGRKTTGIKWIKQVDGTAHADPADNKNADVQEALTEEISKMDLPEFKRFGADKYLRDPKTYYRSLIADLRYLGNSGYPELKKGERWGGWTMDDVLRYFAKAVDALRSIHFPILPPLMGAEEYTTTYWECYRKAKKYMKSRPPSAEEVKDWDRKRKASLGQVSSRPVSGVEKSFSVRIFEKREDEHIVAGVVYAPGEVDAQGDWATEDEIRKAAYRFMEEKRNFKLLHRGDNIRANVLESYISPAAFDYIKPDGATERIEKGSWILVTRLLDERIWQDVKAGVLTGYSMAGRSRVAPDINLI